jgi:hypothetical protein
MELSQSEEALSFSIYATKKSSFELSDICDKEFHKMTQTFDMTAKYEEPKEGPERKAPSSKNRPVQEKVIDNELDAKKIRVWDSYCLGKILLLTKVFAAKKFELVK